MRIAVVGAGPAGLVAAIAARRLGFDVVAFEQAPDFSRVGSAVGIQANGRQALAALGLLESFTPPMRVLRYGSVRAPPGTVLSHADTMEVDIPQAGFAVVLRHDLQQNLLEAALRDRVDVQFGARCTGAERGNGRAVLRFADGSSHEADVVLACDGIHSAVRDSLGFAAKKSVVGEAYLRGVSSAEIRDPTYVAELWGNDGRRFGMFPIGSGGTYFFCSVPLGRWPEIRTTWLPAWVQSWRDFGDEVMHILSGVEDWENTNYDELKEVRLDRWCDPPFFLVGDAAHAMTPNLGQGANSSMVDALVLARVLRETVDAGQPLEYAAREYEQLRRGFVTRIQTYGRQGGQMAAWTSAPARTLRRLIVTASTSIPAVRRRAMIIAAGYNKAEQRYLGTPLHRLDRAAG